MKKETTPDTEYGTRFEKIIGSDIQNFEIKFLKSYDFLPELMLHFGSFIVKKTFVRQTATVNGIEDGISFHFYNFFEDATKSTGKNSSKQSKEAPFVRIFPIAITQKIKMTKDTQATHLSVAISMGYLKQFLNEEVKYFQFLFDQSHNFLIEEIMTDDILRTVNEIVRQDEPSTLKSYHYRLKSMELLYYLFKSLRKRTQSVHEKLSENDINAIYKVRDQIIFSLSKPSTIAELIKIAGMNELKMRRIFKQVFGKGIYDYYQHIRMKEAARLLREEKLSVSQVGYQMGFENLSHFTRVFEKHIGNKPKRYSSEFN